MTTDALMYIIQIVTPCFKMEWELCTPWNYLGQNIGAYLQSSECGLHKTFWTWANHLKRMLQEDSLNMHLVVRLKHQGKCLKCSKQPFKMSNPHNVIIWNTKTIMAKLTGYYIFHSTILYATYKRISHNSTIKLPQQLFLQQIWQEIIKGPLLGPTKHCCGILHKTPELRHWDEPWAHIKL